MSDRDDEALMQTAYSVEPSLPFVLLERPASAAADLSSVALRLDALQGLVEDTRSELRDLGALLSEHIGSSVSEGFDADLRTHIDASVPRVSAEGAALSVSLFGSLEVQLNGKRIGGWKSRKARLLFAYLALDPSRAVSRETLIEQFWPGSTPSRGANNLSIAVHHIRSRFAEALSESDTTRGIEVQHGQYRLEPDLPWAVDVVEFRAAVLQAKVALGDGDDSGTRSALEGALETYAGDLLDSDRTEEWTLEPRQELVALFEWSAGWLAADAASRGEWVRVLELGDALLRRDGADEAGHRWLTRAYLALGNRAQAIRQLAACVARLREEFGVGPSRETRELLSELELE